VEDLPEQLTRVQAMWDDALALLTPAACWTVLPVGEFLAKLAPEARESAALQRWVADCNRVALLAVSLGENLERQARELIQQRESFAGYILDRMGSYLAESWMSVLDRHVEEALREQGYCCTRRYSPGYSDTPLEMQDLFLEFAQRSIPYLRLSDAHVLLPEKSVFALKGVAEGRSDERTVCESSNESAEEGSGAH
jgi:hypothetical protein